MDELFKLNSNKFFLTVIDRFSKYSWAILLDEQSGKSIIKLIKVFFDSHLMRKPKRLQTEKKLRIF